MALTPRQRQARRLWKMRALGLGYDGGFDYYVDSVNGNDANTGTSEAQAFATISAAQTAALAFGNNVRIGLARGSSWAEELDLASLSGVTIGAYGSGRKPRISAKTAVSSGSWTKTVGRTNVYEVTWTPTAATKVVPSVWEDGVRLTRVADLATCDSTAGSFYASNSYSDGVPAGLYVHPTGSTNPTSDGKTYEQATRYSCIHVGDNATISNVYTVACQAQDGVVIAGRFATVNDCVFEDGHIHHLFTGSGTVTDCTAYRGDSTISVFAGTTGIAFIAYNTANVADPMVWTRCVVISNSGTTSFNGGFYAHAQAGQISFGDVRVVDCEGYNLDGFVVGAAQAESLTISGSLSYNCGRFLSNSTADSTLAGGTIISGCEWFVDRIMSEVTYRGMFRPQTSTARTVTIQDSFAVLAGTSANFANNPINWNVSGMSGELNLTRLAVLADPLAGGATGNVTAFAFNASGSGTLDVNMTDCTSQGFAGYSGTNARGLHANFNTAVALTASGTVLANYNGATERGEVIYQGATYTTGTAYLAALQPGNEVGSQVVSSDQFTDPSARDYSLTVGAVAAAPVMTPKHNGQSLATVMASLVSEIEAA